MVAARFEQGSALALWQGLVAEGEDSAGVRLSETTESYLVFLLMQHLRDGALAGRALALEWLSALERVGTLRAEQLREVGDRSLLIAGLYPGLAERRRVGREYSCASASSPTTAQPTAPAARSARCSPSWRPPCARWCGCWRPCANAEDRTLRAGRR
jgi:hypothetical protein